MLELGDRGGYSFSNITREQHLKVGMPDSAEVPAPAQAWDTVIVVDNMT